MSKRGARTPGRPGGGAPSRRTAALALAVLIAWAWTAPAAAERWLPLGEARGERAPRTPDADARLRAERRAEVEALTAGLKRGLALPEPEAALAARAGEVDTARVMLCLLGFRENRRPDLTTVPADGKFMAATDTLPDWLTRVDPPPHDAAFFAAHMRAMREFYRIQSYGRLEIEWDIVAGPAADGGLFLLPDIADYGPGEAGDFWTLELLEAFVRSAVDSIDAVLQAAPGGPRFADYDHVMIFHAGSDLQNDIFGDSPNDLPSFNIFFGDPPLVDGGSHALGSVLLLPETTTQDTDPNDPIYGALNAVTAHEFGHQLDLADTYNTYWGWPSVGYWDLMDSGHQILFGFQTAVDPDNPIYVYGALPTSFAIWHRMLLGWVETDDASLLRPGGGEHQITLTASNVQAPGSKALRVDLSEREYFLLENRQELLWQGSRYVKSDDDTGVFQFVSKDFPAFPDSAENSGEYDLFLPQSGLLAWRVDERNFETLYPLNIINLDGDEHVQLVEADGTNDLGDPYSFEWRGGDRDPFYTGNVTEWLETGVPDTRLRDGTPSGFRLTELVTSPYLASDAYVDSTISFRIARAGVPDGLPRDDREAVAGVLAVLPAAGSLLPLVDGDALWLGYAMDSLDPDTLLQTHLLVSGSEAGGEPPLELQPPRLLSSTLAGSALLAAPGPGAPAWYLLTSDSLLIWGPPAAGAAPALLESYWLPAAPLTLPVALTERSSGERCVVWLAEDGQLYLVEPPNRRGQAGGLINALSLGERSQRGRQPVIAPLVRVETAGGTRVGVAVDDTLSLVDLFGAAATVRLGLPDPGEGPFWIRPVDLDGDGSESPAELFWIHVDGRAVTLGEEGWTPRFTAPLAGERLSADPAVADLDGDGQPEFFLAAGDRVHRLSAEGFAYADWPLRLGELADLELPMRVGSGLRAADLTGDSIAELILFGDSGHLIVADASGRPVLGTPRSLAAAPPQDLISLGGQVFAISRDGFLLGFTGAATAAAPEWGAGGGSFARDGHWQRQHAIQALDTLDGEAWLFYPNPAAEECRLHHPAVPAGTHVRLELFDLEGQLKFTREATAAADGPFEIPLELRSLAAGVYFGRIEAGDGGRHCLRRLAVLR